ncbi:MAG: hypothetical protein UU61_C0040G0003 [Parcubacteria group bacterium GW2011_GWB1_41_4]|nr:MAG: hypothetical protein UU61_C0040G0003 [Parcubacteria group bacterium GW2011_GWB1_41_4]
MKKILKTLLLFFTLFSMVFSWQVSPVFSRGGVDSEEDKMPWLQAFETCPIGTPTSLCLAIKAAASGWISYEKIGVAIDNVEKAIEDVGNLMSLSVSDIIRDIIAWIASLVGNIVSKMIYLAVFLMSPDTFQYATFPAVQAGFYVSLQIANAMLAIGMVILANKFILGMESYGNLKSLTRYLVTAILINFSLAFASYGVGISNFMTIAFLDGAANFGENSSGSFNGTASLSYEERQNSIMDKFSDTFSQLAADKGDSKADVAANIATLFTFIIFSLFFIVLLAAIAVSLVMRVIGLWALMMVVPLAIAADTVFSDMDLPGVPIGSGNFKKWKDSFIKYLSFAPIMAGVIFFVFLVMGQFEKGAFAISEYDPNTSMLMASFGETLGLIVALVLLYKGYEFANSSSSAVPKFMDSAVKGVINYPAKAGQSVKRSATKFGYGFADSDIGRGLQRALINVPVLSRYSQYLGKKGVEGERLRKEDVDNIKGQYEHMYSMAKNDKERQRVIDKAMYAGSGPLFGPLKGSFDPAKHGGALEFLGNNDDGKEALAKQIAERSKNTANDVYRANPVLAGDKIGGFARNMTPEDLAKLNAEVLKQVIPHVSSASTLKNVVDKVSGDSIKSAAIFDNLYSRINESNELSKTWAKDGTITYWLERQSKENSQAGEILDKLRTVSAESPKEKKPRGTILNKKESEESLSRLENFGK